MLNKLPNKLREYTATLFIFMGLAVAVLGGVLIKAGAWIGDIAISPVMDSDDLSDEQFRQVIKAAEEARESRGDKA